MRVVIQRTLRARVTVDGEVVGETRTPGLLVYLGVTHDDGLADLAWTARKVWELRLLR
ncbi:MAG: D-aminoacyl-tRNA deacylase, partial [Nocardioides sp.]|nr:D-aminoacyl-tRNA deacylase [Nocardioides sp.]